MFEKLGSLYRSSFAMTGMLGLLAVSALSSQPAQTAERLITEGQSFTRSLSGGQTHTYDINLVAGQFFRLVVEQQGIDVIIKVVGTGGQTIVEIDRPNGSQGTEAVSLVAPETGDYRIEVRPASRRAPAAKYLLKLWALRRSQPQDQLRMEAEQAISKGERLRPGQTLEAKREAINQFELARGLWEQLGERYEEAVALYGLGLTHRLIGENQTAVTYLKSALVKMQTLGNRYGEAITQTGLAWSYLYLGETDKALDNFFQSQRLRYIVNDRSGEALTLYGIGWAYANRGDQRRALDYFEQSLQLRREFGDRRGEAIALVGIGQLYGQLQRGRESLPHLHRALEIVRELGDSYLEADALDRLGWTHLAFNEVATASEYFQQALPLRRKVGDRMGEAQVLYGLAQTEYRRKNLKAARDYLDASLVLIESSRAEAATPQFRTSYFASVVNYYQFAIKVLMRLHEQEPASGHAIAALQMSERMRARSLLDLLAEAQIRAGAPRFASLTQHQSLSLAELQNQILDDRTLLLEYALGEECSYLWAVTSTSFNSYELHGRAEIEAAVRRLLSLLNDNQQRVAQNSVNSEQANRSFHEAAAALSQMLLGPAAAQLKGQRLVIVADGALQYAPFAALPSPVAKILPPGNDPESLTPDQPLMVEHEIIILPSVSVLASLRRQFDGRRKAPKAIAMLADPVFDSSDVRVETHHPRRSRRPQRIENDRTKNKNEAQLGTASTRKRFPRLPFTRQEAGSITALAPPDQRLLALDFAANRATATSAELAQYRIIHFATHSLLDQDHPELSGIALSLVDAQGRPQNGFLHLQEIYDLRLNADLVVLSACQTALGKEVKGEGLIGLTRGFMYAGAPRVVATLWKVDDRATAEFMKHFYQALLGEQQLRPAAALRVAQLALWRQKRWRNPGYWAAFTLQGEWK